MSKLLRSIAAAGLVAAAAVATSPAHAVLITFDTLANVTNANLDPVASAAGITFTSAFYTPDVDSFGDTIPGTERWRPDPAAGPIVARNPSTANWGAAPSPLNALDARLDQVLMRFATPQSLVQFGVALDNSTLGNLGISNLLLLNASGGTIGTIALQQSVPGGFYAYNGPLVGLTDVLLPAGAFYDNIQTVVPVPSAWLAMVSGLVMLGVMVGRRRGTGGAA